MTLIDGTHYNQVQVDLPWKSHNGAFSQFLEGKNIYIYITYIPFEVFPLISPNLSTYSIWSNRNLRQHIIKNHIMCTCVYPHVHGCVCVCVHMCVFKQNSRNTILLKLLNCQILSYEDFEYLQLKLIFCWLRRPFSYDSNFVAF